MTTCAAWRGPPTASTSALARPAPKCRCTAAATGHHACVSRELSLNPASARHPSLSGLASFWPGPQRRPGGPCSVVPCILVKQQRLACPAWTLTGCWAGCVQIWDVGRMKQVRALKGHSARVSALAWSGTTLSSGGRDSNIVNHDVRCTCVLSAPLESCLHACSPASSAPVTWQTCCACTSLSALCLTFQ